MKIIDVNTSIGSRDSYGRLVTLQLLLAQMEDYRIDHAVCYHEYALLDPKSGNALMKELSQKTSGRVGVSAVMDPILGADNLPGKGDLVERLQAFGAESLHIFPDNNRTVFCAIYWEEILDAANRLSLPVIIDDDYPQDFFARLPDIAAQYPHAKFVLVRYGLCQGRHVLPLLKRCRNVYFTVEHMLDNDQIEELRSKAGVQKLLFGTSWPKLSPSGTLGIALYAHIPEQDREMILCKNWEAMSA